MVALRPLYGDEDSDGDSDWRPPVPDPADWLTLQQAACELNISISTARRMIRKGKLRNRIVPRPGGFAYRVYLPNSRHAALGKEACAHGDGIEPDERTPRDLTAFARSKNGHSAHAPATDADVRRLEQQVEHLSEALARALRTKQRALPEGVGQPTVNPADPYARYRWLVRRKRWRLF